VEDAVSAFYAFSATFFEVTPSLIQQLFRLDFKSATAVLRSVCASLIADRSTPLGVLAGAITEIFDTLQFVSHPEQLTLVDIMAALMAHFRTIVKSPRASRMDRQYFSSALLSYFGGVWLTGRLDEALALTYDAMQYDSSPLEADGSEDRCDWLICRSFILYDLGRFDEAEGVLQVSADGDYHQSYSFDLFYPLVRSRILRRKGKTQQALHLLAKRTTPPYLLVNWDDILVIELVGVHLDLGNSHQALELAVQAVALCRHQAASSHGWRTNYILSGPSIFSRIVSQQRAATRKASQPFWRRPHCFCR
jgi:hypothetical protein